MPKEARNMVSFMMFNGEKYDNYEEYMVVERNDNELQPTGIDFVGAISNENDNNVNVGTATQMVKNNTSSMLKKGTVQTAGVKDYTGWSVIADEGAAEGSNPYGPSPLSFYTAGVASSLHTQIINMANLEGVVLDNITVEVSNDFRWDDMMAADGTGHLDLTTINIIIESDASDAVIEKIKEEALNAWAVGEALRTKTTVIPHLVINGDDWDTYYAKPGTALSDVSYSGDMKLSSISDAPREPEYLELKIADDEGDTMSIDSMSNMAFQIFAISESAGNEDRPYLKKITISTPTEETWEIYSDEFVGNDDTPLAPTSLEYFTIGTTLCLTSQTTLVSAMMGIDYTDYRVEHLFEYKQKDVNTTEMKGLLDTIQTYVFIESDESNDTLETFFNKSLALCFAGDGLANETEMDISVYLNGTELK
jgi:uncharacterized OsmC-like protein